MPTELNLNGERKMNEDEETSAFDLPEETKEQIIYKIQALAWQIRNDWSDPRSECRRIEALCSKLKTM